MPNATHPSHAPPTPPLDPDVTRGLTTIHHSGEHLLSYTEAEFSHGICPECVRRLYPEIADEIGRA